ncbi:MAG: protein of unknown function (DUF4145) [Candidatus Nitrotoga sp. SPKER]|nr:MAG: protein of unknown function (DUF4145) [Candidatus Nitrotoga sp. SPKER]
MTTADPSPLQKLIAALEQSDTFLRQERAERIVWMSQYNQRPSVIMGSAEALGVLGEAEAAFREGHFISVILLAQALVEHELVEELVHRQVASYGVTLNQALEAAKEHQVLADELFERIHQLRQLRNPFAHLKKPDHSHNFGNRYIARQIHPKVLLREDAEKAFKVMYEVFRALLRAV